MLDDLAGLRRARRKKKKVQIEVGKLADFTVLSQDIMKNSRAGKFSKRTTKMTINRRRKLFFSAELKYVMSSGESRHL